MRGDIEETKLKAVQTDSSNSDCEENTDVDEIQMKNTHKGNGPKEKSKWSAYVEKEEVSAVKEPEFIDNVEVCLELPQKRKINRKPKSFKVPKVSYNIEGNQKTEIINEIINKLPDFEREESNSVNGVNRPIELLSKNKEINKFELSESKSKVFNKSAFRSINKNSKWAHYVTEEDNENDEPNDLVTEEYNDENMEYYDNYKAENNNYNYCIQKEEHNIITFPKDEHEQKSDLSISNSCKETKTFHKSLTVEPIFSISDDNDLDNILDF